MLIWLITIGEPLPTDEGNCRPLRSGILADLLADRGHEVLWWTSTFDHVGKRQRFNKDTEVEVRKGYRLRLLHAAGYGRNVSLRRICNHRTIGRKFKRLVEAEPAPNIVLCSFPTLELSAAAVEYGRRKRVPVVLDIRDMWPDVFLRAMPWWAGRPGRLALRGMFKTARTACAGAFAICGHTTEIVRWGLECGNRRQTQYDKAFPFGYVSQNYDDELTARAAGFWDRLGVTERQATPVVCFFGTIGHQFDLGTVLRAARSISQRHDVKFVLCGAGDRLEHYRKRAKDCPNVLFPGWVDAPQIQVLMRRARLALAPYRRTVDFINSIPNKAIEYLSGGLPVLSSMGQGTLHDLLIEHDCGMSYDGRPETLAEIICRLCESPQRLDQMSGNALQLFEARFTASKVYAEMADYLEGIAALGMCLETRN